MSSFKDSENREWKLSINFHSLRSCKDNGIDLTDGQTVIRLSDDPYSLGMTLWTLVESQAEKRDVSPEAFAEACGSGEVVAAAADALMEALLDFTRPDRREALRKAMAAKAAVDRQAIGMAMEMIDGGEIEKAAEKELNQLRSSISATS